MQMGSPGWLCLAVLFTEVDSLQLVMTYPVASAISNHQFFDESAVNCTPSVWLCCAVQVSRFVRLDIDPKNVMWRRVVDINDRCVGSHSPPARLCCPHMMRMPAPLCAACHYRAAGPAHHYVLSVCGLVQLSPACTVKSA